MFNYAKAWSDSVLSGLHYEFARLVVLITREHVPCSYWLRMLLDEENAAWIWKFSFRVPYWNGGEETSVVRFWCLHVLNLLFLRRDGRTEFFMLVLSCHGDSMWGQTGTTRKTDRCHYWKRPLLAKRLLGFYIVFKR